MHKSFIPSLLAVGTFLLAACAPGANPLVSAPAAGPTAAGAAPGAAPVAATGLQMQVGSQWPYVDGTLLVPVPSGPFTMGNDMPDSPTHTVTLSDFWIYSTKVTNQQFAACVKGGGCTAPDGADNPGYSDPANADHPVVGVTYDQASAYCGYVHARLPTEAQWEKTARGPDAKTYPWGNDPPTCDLLNFNKCVGKTTTVTNYPQGQSYYHALDMEGNVYEWVGDHYDAGYYKVSPPQDPPGPDSGKFRSVRSSSFDSLAVLVPAATRSFELPTNHRSDLGFRCVPIDPTYFAPFCQTATITGLTGPTTGTGSCPGPTFKTVPACPDGKTPGMFVTVDPFPVPSGGWIFVPPECTPVGPGKYFCTKPIAGDVGLVVSIACTAKGTGASASASTPLCLPGYLTAAGKTVCTPSTTVKTGTACLPGSTLDPANQCCSTSTSSTTGGGPCPPGYSYISKDNTCARSVAAWPPYSEGDCPNKPPGNPPEGPPGGPPPPPPPPPPCPNCPPQ